MKTKVVNFIKKETVLCVAWVLAVISACFVRPGIGYIRYIDFKSLGILWSLMVIVSGLRKNGLFQRIGMVLLEKTKYMWQLALLLVLLPFLFSMLITNDVALLTFVPFAIYILKLSGREKLLIPVIAFQTLAANLGSMLTPIGNPQNLYLYGISGLKMGEFISLMLPYTLMSMVLLLAGVLSIRGKGERIDTTRSFQVDRLSNSGGEESRKNALYGMLFFLAVCCVAFPKMIPYQLLVLIVLAVFFLLDKEVISSADYSLLLTFVGFFLFTGNLGQMEIVKHFMTSAVKGHEALAGVISSQFISNVPAALLLSGFTSHIGKLIVGINLGGLGTLIASMASLISFKLLTDEYHEIKGTYFLYFTAVSLIFLGTLLLENRILG